MYSDAEKRFAGRTAIPLAIIAMPAPSVKVSLCQVHASQLTQSDAERAKERTAHQDAKQAFPLMRAADLPRVNPVKQLTRSQ